MPTKLSPNDYRALLLRDLLDKRAVPVFPFHSCRRNRGRRSLRFSQRICRLRGTGRSFDGARK